MCFIRKNDEVSVFNRTLRYLELVVHKGSLVGFLTSKISKEDGLVGWTPLISSGELQDGFINFECNASSTDISSIELYLTETEPVLQNLNFDNWYLLDSINYEEEEFSEPFSVVMNTYDIPDGDSWFLVAKGYDANNYPVYDYYEFSFRTEHFDELIDFNYIDTNGRINKNSDLEVIPLEGYADHIANLKLFVNLSNDIQYLTNVSYNDLTSNDWKISLESLSNWAIDNNLIPDTYIINFIVEAELTYAPNFGNYLFNYTLDEIILDTRGPDLILLTSIDGPYSLELGRTYDDVSQRIITMAINSSDPDFVYVELEYKYETPNTAEWTYLNSFYANNELLALISWDILNFRDDNITFRFVGYDNLGNSEVLTNSTFWFVKDFDNNLGFTLEGLNNQDIYTLNQNNLIDLGLDITPYANDVSNVIVSTTYETFNLSNVLYEQDHIYFAENIALNSIYYGIFGSDFTFIPIEINLYQGPKLLVSRYVVITVATDVFDFPVEISNITIDISNSIENVNMSFVNGRNSYNNSFSIPYISNNQTPVVKLYNSHEELVEIIPLHPHLDATSSEIYDTVSIEIIGNKFIIPLPTIVSGEFCSLEEVTIEGNSYPFSYFVNSKNDELFVVLDTEDELDGIYDSTNPISINYGISTEMRLSNQFLTNYDFTSLPQDNYVFIGEFYDVAGSTSMFEIDTPITIDFEGPYVYKQFGNGMSINSENGAISFIVDDISPIANYNLSYSGIIPEGYWVINDNLYTFHFNDITISEGIHSFDFICEDNLGYITSKQFTLFIDRTAPTITNLHVDSFMINDLCNIEVIVTDISTYSLDIKIISQISGIPFSDLEYTKIEISEDNWQIIFDTAQLPNGYYEIYLSATDLAGNKNEANINDIYFDNEFPQIIGFEEEVYNHPENIFNKTVENEMFFNDKKHLSISALDNVYDGFVWNSPSLANQFGIKYVNLIYSDPLETYNLSIKGSLNYDTLTYTLDIPYIKLIKDIQNLKIGEYEINKFTVILNGSSILLQIDPIYRYALSPLLTNNITAQYYLLTAEKIPFTFNDTLKKWELLSPGRNYFNISDFLTLSQGQKFLAWVELEDGLGNKLLSHKYVATYDSILAQDGESSLFTWPLGTNSEDIGIILFGSDVPKDSTIHINTASILHNYNNEEDVNRVYIHGSSDQVNWEPIGRAHFSGEKDIWTFYWNGDLLDTLPPQDYFLKVRVFDEAGNYISQIIQTKIYDYTEIELYSDLIFGHYFDYNYSAMSNEQDIEGTISNFFDTTDVWDIVNEFYNPEENEWIPLSYDSATILTNGSYKVTWDINRNPEFFYNMDDFEYGYLPLQAVPLSSEQIWGSWATFSDSGDWQPFIVSEIGGNLDITIYEYNSSTGWEVDTTLSNEMSISSVANQTFRLFDINQDNKFELIRTSTSQIDVLYLDGNSIWNVAENITSVSGLQYFTFDFTYEESTSNTLLVAIQRDIATNQILLCKYKFESNFTLTQLISCEAPSNFIPTIVKIINSFTETETTAILLGGLIEGSSYSQIIQYNFDLTVEDVLSDLILGKVSLIEYDEFGYIGTIILGVERGFISKMDSVITLRKEVETEEWIAQELTITDEARFEIFDMITIEQDNLQKLIIASNTGLFSTKITNKLDKYTITSPICYTYEIFEANELLPENYPIIELEHTPIYEINKISYQLINDPRWYELDKDNYRFSRTEVKFDLSSIYSNIEKLKVAYSFESYESEKRSSVDPSFQSYSGSSDTQSLSASSVFYDDTALPLLWLNPGTAYIDPYPIWNTLPNGMTHQSIPIVSGLGTKATYPTSITTQGEGLWGPEYEQMIELDNSMISYGDSYDSGILSEQTNGKEYTRPDLVEDEFDGRFEGQYIDKVYYSNPYVSDNYDFSKLYDENIHNSSNDNGYYNYYGGSQYTLLENELTNVEVVTTKPRSDSGIYSSGSLPNMNPDIYEFEQNINVTKVNNAVNNWSQYLTSYEKVGGSQGYGLEFTYNLPMIPDKNSLQYIQIDFDASIVNRRAAVPLSIVIYNFERGRWEAIPIGQVGDSPGNTGAYTQSGLDLWKNFFYQGGPNYYQYFVPNWRTTSIGATRTVSFGNTFPNWEGGVIIDNPTLYTQYQSWVNSGPILEKGANFLDNNVNDNRVKFYGINAQNHLRRYAGGSKSALFNMNGLRIDPTNFYTSHTNLFPKVDTTPNQFRRRSNFQNYLNSNGEFKVRILSQSNTADGQLCVGTFKTYSLANTEYLNYDNFESKIFNDHINVTDTGLELYGTNEINTVASDIVSQGEDYLKTIISKNIFDSPKETYNNDGIYWTLDSESQGTDQAIIKEFKAEIPVEKIEGVTHFEVLLNATSTISLENQLFEYYNFTSGEYVPLIPEINGALLNFSILTPETCLNGSSYEIRFRLTATSSSPFQISIEQIQAFSYGEWMSGHDVYNARFTFEATDHTYGDSITFSLFENIKVELLDLNDVDKGIHEFSFYYNFTNRKFSAFLDNIDCDYLKSLPPCDFGIPQLGIETHFANDEQGIKLMRLESQYYKRIEDDRAFEEYKSLLNYYNSIIGYTDKIDIPDGDIGNTPLFTYLSSDINVIYSFNDNMNPDNIFNTNYNPKYETNIYDNLVEEGVPTSYYEKGFVVGGYWNGPRFFKYSGLHGTTWDATANPVVTYDEYHRAADGHSGDSGIYGFFPMATDLGKSVDFSVEQAIHKDYQRPDGGTSTLLKSQLYYTPESWYDDMDYIEFSIEDFDLRNQQDYHGYYVSGIRVQLVGYRKSYLGWGEYHYGGANAFTRVFVPGLGWSGYQASMLNMGMNTNSKWFGVPSWCKEVNQLKVGLKHERIAPEPGDPEYQTSTLWIDQINVWLTYKSYPASHNHYQEIVAPDEASFFHYLHYKFRQTESNHHTIYLYVEGEEIRSATYASWVQGVYHPADRFTSSWRSPFVQIYSPSAPSDSWGAGWDVVIDELKLEYYIGCSTKANGGTTTLTEDWSRNFTSTDVVEHGVSNDPFFGKNNYRYSIENSLITPVFGRKEALAYTDIDLLDVDFDFEVYNDPDYNTAQGFLLENNNLEGKDYIVNNYEEYSQNRLKDSALDDIQIPLISPIELDFGSIDIDEYSNFGLELALDFDIDLANRLSDTEWNSRFRLLIYNYTSSSWLDYNGMIQAENYGVRSSVWNARGRNFIDYLQEPNRNDFFPIYDENNIRIINPLFVTNINNDTMTKDGKIKLALMSYTFPGNFTGHYSNGHWNYISYERADSLVPINISQSVNVLDCLLFAESQQTLFPEGSIHAEVPLDENFMANLSDIEYLGEIITIQGEYIDSDKNSYFYPISSYEIRENNLLSFNHPMYNLFTNISIEYLPQMSLIYDVNNDWWYLPDELVIGEDVYSKPIFISSLYVNDTLKKNYIHESQDVGYRLDQDEYGRWYVEFTDLTHSDSDVRGSIHFSLIGNQYLYKTSLHDDLLYPYKVLDEGSDITGGTLRLDMDIGFTDVYYSELTQVKSAIYSLTIDIFTLDINNIESPRLIGTATIDLDSSLLGFHNYQLNIPLDDDFFTVNGKELFKEAITRGSNYNLIISVESSIFNCKVDGNLFKGLYAQEMNYADISFALGKSDLIYNGAQVETPYIPIPHNEIILSKIYPGVYEFGSLLYSFGFDIDSIFTNDEELYENIDYIYNTKQKLVILVGRYLNYSGNLYANITYRTFEWTGSSISSLEPITISFNNDYLENITKYLEFIIDFDSIPGYDIENIDYGTGKVVQSNERKGPEMLNIYLYNFVDDTWDLIDFVTFDNYAGTNIFSYMVDRNFITFEKYFDKTAPKEFQLKAIFTIEENVDDFVVCRMGFDINSIDGRISYSTPDTEYSVNPAVEFDIDLTKYFTDSEINLEQITVSLDYFSEIEFDDAFLFSNYALLQEHNTFYLQNKYLEFEQVELNNDKFNLTLEELKHFIYYDIENDKYYLRAKIEYDWNCILEVNLGCNSKLEILSKLHLVKYDLSVSYAHYETTRISAQEYDNPFDLAAIYAPNYIETYQGIYNKPDDEEVDIGTFGGFLRSSSSNQRVMFRQKLYYKFTEAQNGDTYILLDQEYTDCNLRFIIPYGQLLSPVDFVLDTTDFIFIADEDVISVEFYYHNGTEYIKGGNMTQDLNDPHIYNYTWVGASTDTNTISGDVIKIIFNITNAFGGNGKYEYCLIADFNNPSPGIILGTGNENYETNLIADPTTPISLNSNEVMVDGTNKYTWVESFTSFDSSYMSNRSLPNDYSSSMNMDPLTIANNFPESPITSELWDSWTLTHDPILTDSDFNNGLFSSILNSDTISYATISKSINDNFLNHYDSNILHPDYKKLYNITVGFDYQFTIADSNYDDYAEVIIDGNSFILATDNSLNSFLEIIEFDSDSKDEFEIMFNISNGVLELSNMEYSYKFLCVDTNDNMILQQNFEVGLPNTYDLLPFRNFKNVEFVIYNSYIFSPGTDSLLYHNTDGRTNKLEIEYKIKCNGNWFSSIYSTNLAESNTQVFNVSEFMSENYLTLFQDFSIEYMLIGDDSELIINQISLNCSTTTRKVQEFYRIIDNNLGYEYEWINFNSSSISILGDFGQLPTNFSIEYKVIDQAGNVGIDMVYNNEYRYIIYSQEKTIILEEDYNSIDLNKDGNRLIKFLDSGQFGGIEKLDAYINGFKYGTATLSNGLYELSFGSENSIDTLFAYSDSLLSSNIYSNIDPSQRTAWEVSNEDYFAVAQHVLVDNDIIITVPIAGISTVEFSLEHLYDRNFGLPDFSRINEAYFYNSSADNEITLLEDSKDYFVSKDGQITFGQLSIVHELYNNMTDVKDGIIYFDYYTSSELSNQLSLSNAEGFFINFTMPAIYYEHTTIELLTINFIDIEGNVFTREFFDYDLRKYFLEDVKSQYETDIFGLGKMMTIPLYLPMKAIDFDQLESIIFTIKDSKRWPGSFIQEIGEDINVLNLPYQRIAISDIKLYNLISDSSDFDENGFVSSEIMFKAPDFYNFYAKSNFQIKRLDIKFSGLKAFAYREEMSQNEITDLEYSDFVEVLFRWEDSLSPIILNNLVDLPITMINNTSNEILSFCKANWIKKFEYNPLSDFYKKNYYYCSFQTPFIFDEFDISFSSIGNPIFNISFIDPPSFTINTIQENLSSSDPIYLSKERYELEYGEILSLDGIILDNDEYLVEDEVYQYKYLEAIDGITSHNLNPITPPGDEDFIDRNQFAIYYVDNVLEKIPLYDSLGDNEFTNTSILDQSKKPSINYVDNEYILNIHWKQNSTHSIKYDTYLLFTYKITKGRPISPISFPTIDSYGNNLYDNLIEIPFAQYDMLSRDWKTEENFTEILSLHTKLLYKEIKSDSAIIKGIQYQEDEIIQTGIVSIDSIFVNRSTSEDFVSLNTSNYSWSITVDGELNVIGLDYNIGDVFHVYYLAYEPVFTIHSLNKPISEITYFKIINRTGDEYLFVEHQDFEISQDGYTIYFLDFYNSVMKNNYFTIYDDIEIQYHSSLARKVDLCQNIILTAQDSKGNYIPIDNINVDILGLFEYNKKLKKEGPLSLPLGGGKQIVNLQLKYMPESIFNKLSDSLTSINYESKYGEKLYPYKESNSWTKPFTVITIPKKVKLSMVNEISQNIVIQQKFIQERVYQYNYNPMETLEKGEEYTHVSINALVQENYEFTFQLLEYEDELSTGDPCKDSIIWLQIGLLPKAKTGFKNERVIIEEFDTYPYFESLGTDEISFEGPGESSFTSNRMFGKPLTYELEHDYNTNYTAYGPYLWQWTKTDETGKASFNVSLNREFLEDYIDIFGLREGFSSVENVTLYIRAFSSYFDWDDFAIEEPNQYLCSSNSSVYDGSYKLDNYDFSDLVLQDSTYVEGLINLNKKDIALGTTDYYSYELPDPTVNQTFKHLTMYVHLSEAKVIPDVDFQTMSSLTRVHPTAELEPLNKNILGKDYHYYANIQFINPSGHLIDEFYKQIIPSSDGNTGYFTLDNMTMIDICRAAGPGISTIKVQIEESEYYKPSNVIMVPCEIRPPNYFRFGEKNLEMDLINPFINNYGNAFEVNGQTDEETLMPYESNYPHLKGSVWIEPYFDDETGHELSIEDYIEISLNAETTDEFGEVSSFPLRKSIMLRPGNREGILEFDVGLGPEDAFLMGIACQLNLTFDISYNAYNIFNEERDIDIYILDLRLESNPSSSTPDTIWWLYRDGFDSDTSELKFSIDKSENGFINNPPSEISLGGNETGTEYGIEFEFIYNPEESNYSINDESSIFDLLALNNIEPLKIINSSGDEVVNWSQTYPVSENLQEQSVIEFDSNPNIENFTTFTIIYEFDFNFNSHNYGHIKLGSENNLNMSWIAFDLEDGFLPDSENSYSPMFVRYNQTIIGDGTATYFLDYGIEGAGSEDNKWDDDLFIVYSSTKKIADKKIFDNYPRISFNETIPTGQKEYIIYGVRSQYDLGYGFQKIGKPYSDSVKLLYNKENTTDPIIGLQNYKIDDPSLYISLDNSPSETILEIFDIPLLYQPEVNMKFVLDPIVMDIISNFEGSDHNTLNIDFYYVSSGSSMYYSDSIEVLLDYSEMQLDLESYSYIINYDKDLQSLYEIFGKNTLEIYIRISQSGKNNNYIPYIILEKFDYLCDEHIVEMLSNKPINEEGNLDVAAILNTPHWFSIFTKPFVQGKYGETPFNLIDGSEITVEIENLPFSNLVSLNGSHDNYRLNYLGARETLPVNAENYYMIPNLGLFTDGYNTKETIYQDGFVNLYYGSGTNVQGEHEYNKQFYMDYEDAPYDDYESYRVNGEAISWEDSFELTNDLLTTNEIDVSGRVLYHQLFDITPLTSPDIIDSTQINTILNDVSGACFAVQIPDEVDIAQIRTVGSPYEYDLSVQGFPIGDYVDGTYCRARTLGLSIDFDTRLGSEILDSSTDYSLEFASNGSKYIVFYIEQTDALMLADDNNLLMVDYWAYYDFADGFDFEIVEDPISYSSTLNWHYSIQSINSYFMHPDFTTDTSFVVTFSALDWAEVNDEYINDGTDEFIFKPEIKFNLSHHYINENSDTFSILDSVPDTQFDNSDIFQSIYINIWDGIYDASIETFKLDNPIANNYIIQDDDINYLFTLNYAAIQNEINSEKPDKSHIVDDSDILIEINYISEQYRY